MAWHHTAGHDLPPAAELAAVGCTPPGPSSPVLIIDAVSFDRGPSLATLGSCPVADKELASKVGHPVALADLYAGQLQANPDGHRYFVDNAFLTGPRRR
ncbi:hypothetical protein [Streptomyces sp. NPDC001250]|uniref:hypothetical protein n=1 Tax=Streptomyces sp. NPDC001250 TaxID=3154382 RepID=UPI003323301C